MNEEEAERRFAETKKELQDDNVLIKKFNNMTAKWLKDNPDCSIQDAQMFVLVLLAFPYRGSTQLSEDEITEAVNEMKERISKFHTKGLN